MHFDWAHLKRDIDLEQQKYDFLDTLDLQFIYHQECGDYSLEAFIDYLDGTYSDKYQQWQKIQDRFLFDGLADKDFVNYLNKRYGNAVYTYYMVNL